MKVLLTAFFAITVALADDTIRLRLYKRSITSFIEAPLVDAESEIFADKYNYNRNNKTVFIFHGFTESVEVNSVVTVANAFLKRGGINVIGVDWSSLAFTGNSAALLYYPIAASNTEIVGKKIAKLIQDLDLKGLLIIKNLILVGHSLGAQLCGVIGRSLKIRPPLIIGLDPAGPLFSSKKIPGVNQALSLNDADFVQNIVTDSGNLGSDERNVHANFIANAGKRSMPGCPVVEIACSHARSHEYFSEAVLKPGTFKARKCTSLKQFIAGRCSQLEVTLGYPVDTSANGLLYFETDSKSTYGKGQAGTLNVLKYNFKPWELDFL